MLFIVTTTQYIIRHGRPIFPQIYIRISNQFIEYNTQYTTRLQYTTMHIENSNLQHLATRWNLNKFYK